MAGEPGSEKAGQYAPRRTRVTGAFDQEIRLGLRDVPINIIAAAIGRHPSYCVRIRTGPVIAHPRHWAAPRGLVQA